jgi:hypothetical protein
MWLRCQRDSADWTVPVGPGWAASHNGAVLSGYLAMYAGLAATALVSARRGLRAANNR